MANTIIDRRKNPGGRSGDNRQKFIKRTKEEIRRSIHENLGDRSIGGSGDTQDVIIRRRGIAEPQFNHRPGTGSRDIVLPGNKDYIEGDQIEKPEDGEGGAGGSGGSDEGISEDEFAFVLSNEEFVNILFEDLELPHMIHKENKSVESFELTRSGYTNDGSPTQMNLEKSMINSIGRKIALRSPKLRKIKELEEELAELDEDDDRYLEIVEEISKLRIRAAAVAFVDPVDLRFNNFTKKPVPISQAVVFFVMDVSASMSEEHKDLAKRFFMLLNLFVSRKYKKVECVFIRHHILAKECGEEEFFNNRESGGTIVSSAITLAKEIIDSRYSPNEWNIYFAQASDGDNWDHDNAPLLEILSKDILPITQYFSYIQVGPQRNDIYNNNRDDLLKEYLSLRPLHRNIICKYIESKTDIYPVFREIFKVKK